MRTLRWRDVSEDVRKTEECVRTGKPHYRDTATNVAWRPNRTDALVMVQSARSGTWGLPKGKFEPVDNRLVLSCALRELWEETRLDSTAAESVRYIGSTYTWVSQSGHQDHGLQRGKRLHFVEVRFFPGPLPSISVGDGVTAVRWVTSWEEFLSLPMHAARRAHWLAALRAVDINWARPRSHNKQRW